MKTAFLLFFILVIMASFRANASLPPTTLGGQQTTSKPTTFNFKAPNYSATQTNGTESLIETGNSNILSNPDFEHSTYSTSWTQSGGSPALEQTVVISGKKSYFNTLSAATLSFYQDSTLYQAQFADGVQGIATIYAKTSETNANDFFVCPRQAGATTLTNCVKIEPDGKWGLYKVPFILGATSNGIAVVSGSMSSNVVTTGSITGDIYLDNAFVGAVSLTSDSSQIGPWVSFTPTGSWVSNTTYTGRYRQVGQNLQIYYYLITSGAPTSANLTLNLPSGYTIDTAKLPQGTASATLGYGSVRDGGSTYYKAQPIYNSTTSVVVSLTNAASTYAQDGSVVDQVTPFTWGNTDHAVMFVDVPVVELNGNVSTYTASCGANCVDTFSASISTTGVVSNENVDWISGNCSVTSTSVSTCTFNSGIFSVAPNCTVSNKSTNGITDFNTTISASNFETRSANTSNTATALDYYVICQKQGADFSATRTIVGSFKEVMTVPGINKPKTCYYAFGGASATLASPTECTTGTCVEVVDTCGAGSPPTYSATALYQNLTFASGTFANSSYLHCSCVAYDVTAATTRKCETYFDTSDQSWSSNSSGGAVINLVSSSISGTASDAYVSVKCEGQAP